MLPALLALLALQESEPAPYPIDRGIWGEGELAGPVPERAPPPPPPPIEVTDWLWFAGAAPPLGVYLRWAAEGMEPPREGDELEDARWAGGAPPEGATWAFASVTVETDEVRMARLPGAEVLFVNGEGFWGDPRRYGFRGVPVALRAGENALFVTGFDASDEQPPFELELWKPATRCVLGTWDVAWPLCIGREIPDGGLPPAVELPIFNSSEEPIESLHLHYGNAAPEDGTSSPRLAEWADGAWVAPLGMTWARHAYFLGFSAGTEHDPARTALFPLCAYSEGDADAARELVRGPYFGAEPEELPVAPPGRGRAMLARSLLHRHAYEPRHVFDDDLYFVYGTAGTEAEVRRALARARFDQQMVGYLADRVPVLLSDRALLARLGRGKIERAEPTIVLYGNEDTNVAWSDVMPDRLDVSVRRCTLRVGDRERPVDAGGWIRIGRALAVVDTGPEGAALGWFQRWVAAPTRYGELALWTVDAGAEPRLLEGMERAPRRAGGR